MYIVWSIYYEEVLVRICMKLLSWNTAKHLKKVSQQYDLIEQINPDIVIAYTAKPVIYAGMAMRNFPKINFFPIIND